MALVDRNLDGLAHKLPLCADKTTAQAMLAELVRNAERQQAGIVERAAEDLAKPIADHLQDYRQHLFAKGRSEKHIGDTVRIFEKVMAARRCRILADRQNGTDRLEAYLADRLEAGSQRHQTDARHVHASGDGRHGRGRRQSS